MDYLRGTKELDWKCKVRRITAITLTTLLVISIITLFIGINMSSSLLMGLSIGSLFITGIILVYLNMHKLKQRCAWREFEIEEKSKKYFINP